MLKLVRSRLTYANVVATVAVFLALGGGAYALSGIPDRGGVFHACVSNATGVLRMVKGASSCHKARGTGKHRDPGEFAVAWNQKGQPGANGINGASGASGISGTNGTNGTNGINGTNGANGATNVVVRTGNQVTVGPGSTDEASADCNPGERATGGGWGFVSGQVDPDFYESTPTGDPPTGWHLSIWKPNTGVSVTLVAKVICASP